MNVDIKTYLMAHLMWVIIFALVLFAGHSWLQEHDARLLADKQVKISEQQIQDLQAQLSAKVKVITKVVHDAKTPAQVVEAIPKLTDMPLNARVAPDNPAQVSVDAQPLVQLLGQCKIDAAESATKTQIIAEKDKELAALKKPKGFWGKLKAGAQQVGVGVVVGVLLSHL